MTTIWNEEGHTPSGYTTDISKSHVTEPTDAHDASAISYLGSITLSAVNVEAALDELDIEKSPVGHTHEAVAVTKTVRVPHTFTISGDVFVASGDQYYIPPFFVSEPTGQVVTLASARHRINSGTSATVDVRVNGTAATGFGALSVTTTTAVTDPTDVALADGDAISLVVTGILGSPKNLSFTVYLDYTV